jgi:hypothetical protein
MTKAPVILYNYICDPSGYDATIDIRDTSGWSMKFIAFERLSTLSWDIGIGAGPSSFWCILSPQKNWSPKNGTMVVGHCNS